MTTGCNSRARHTTEKPLLWLKSDNGLDHICKGASSPMPKEFTDPAPQCLDQRSYLAQLMEDKRILDLQRTEQFKHLQKVLDHEIQRVTEEIRREDAGFSFPPQCFHQKITLTQIIMVPVDKYPKYNFVGRILGPRGITVRQMEADTGCMIWVRGRGSSKVGARRDSGTDDDTPMHVVVQCEDYADVAYEKMDKALKVVQRLMTPPPNGRDELKRKQLVELAIINGTYRPTAATKFALQTPSPSSGYAEFVKTLLVLINQHQRFVDVGAHPQPTSPSTYSGLVPEATLQDNFEAATMINAVPSFQHDGYEDAPKHM